MSLYGFFRSFSSTTEFPISTSLQRSSCRERNSTIPAPMESPKTLVVVRRRSLRQIETTAYTRGERSGRVPSGWRKSLHSSVVYLCLNHCIQRHAVLLGKDSREIFLLWSAHSSGSRDNRVLFLLPQLAEQFLGRVF